MSGSPLEQTDILTCLFEIGPEALIAIDLMGDILLFNDSAGQMLGYPPAEALDYLQLEDLHANPREAWRILSSLRSNASGRIVRQRVELQHANGQLIPAQMTASLLRDNGGRSRGIVLVYSDLREKLDLTSRLREATQQVMEVQLHQQLDERSSEDLSHLNQPLTVLMGRFELLKEEISSDGALDRIEKIERDLDRLSSMLQDLIRS